MTHEALSQTMSVGLQVSACGGLKLFTSLLTSPTAAINISHHSSSTHRSAGSAGGGGSAGSADIQAGAGQPHPLRGTTSSIQGMCNKQASRALITLVYPQMPVPLANTNSGGSLASASSPLKIGFAESLGESGSPQKQERSPEALSVIPEHLRSPAVGDLFLCDAFPRPWQFSYFYKSGAVKDQFTAYLRFRPSVNAGYDRTVGGGGGSAGATLRGRGVDDIGAFTLSGRAEADISGWSWYINKCYVPFAVDQAPDPDDTADLQESDDGLASADSNSGALTRMERWLQDVEGLLDPPSAVAASTRAGGSSVHVTHVAYWSTGVEDEHRREGQKAARGGAPGAGGRAAGEEDYPLQTASAVVATAATNAATADSELDFVDEGPSGIWYVFLCASCLLRLLSSEKGFDAGATTHIWNLVT
jgi:hypothetical protein